MIIFQTVLLAKIQGVDTSKFSRKTLLRSLFAYFHPIVQVSHKNKKGVSLKGKRVRDFFRTKGFIGIFDGFFLKTKGFLPKVHEIFGSKMPIVYFLPFFSFLVHFLKAKLRNMLFSRESKVL